MSVDELSGYGIDEFAHGGTSRTVLRTGEGPAVIVMAEIPGITMQDCPIDRDLVVVDPFTRLIAR